jgi:deoxyribonuclease-1
MIKRLLILFFLAGNSFANSDQVKVDLHKLVTQSHKPISYAQANNILFTILDNHQGAVCSVYSPSFCITTNVVPSAKIMNVEHTWPQSLGANGIAKSDLHHLFVTESSSNSTRSNLPFCNVQTIKWDEDQSKRGDNSFGENCFEPPANHKGNVARALFYFSIRYNYPIEAHQEFFLREWHKLDPVDTEERERNQSIFKYQNNTNPFIDGPELVDQISDF